MPGRFRPARPLLALGLLVSTTLANAFSPLLTSSSVSAFRTAVSDSHNGKSGRAMAVLESLLLGRVKIGIDASTCPVGREREYRDGIRQALSTWDAAISDSPFELVAPGESADLTVSFVSKIGSSGDVQGLVSANRRFFWGDQSHGYRIEGTIRIKDNAFGHLLTGEEIGRVTAHELGHVLGLDDDYNGPGVMGSFHPGVGHVDPSASEVAAVMEFRREVRLALNAAKRS